MNETKKDIDNVVFLEGALTHVHIGKNSINLTIVVENTKGYSFIPVVVFKNSYSDFALLSKDLEQLSKGIENIVIPKYDKGNEDYFKDYLSKLENVYIEGELNSNTFKGNTTIQVIAKVVK